MPNFEIPQQLFVASAVPKLVVLCAVAWLATKVLAIWFNEQTSSRSKIHAKVTFIGPVIIWIAALVFLLSSLGVGLAAIGNLIIAGGLIIGIVITPAASNAVAGFLNAWGDVFRVGEVLDVDGAVGRVISRRMMSTRIETIDGTMYDIPNKLLLDKIVHNFTRIEGYRIQVEVHIDDPRFSLRRTENVLQTVIGDNPLWNKTGRGTEIARHAQVRYHAMGSSSHVFHVYAWVENRMVASQRQDELLRECALALEEANISFGQTTNIGASFGFPNRENEGQLVGWRQERPVHRPIGYD